MENTIAKRNFILLVLIPCIQSVFFVLSLYFKINVHAGFTTILLIAANLTMAFLVSRGKVAMMPGILIMIIIAAHSLIGQRIAPDDLTEGAIIVTNILVLYVGLEIYNNLPRIHLILYLAGYAVLFVVFILVMRNAQPLFILSLFGLAGTARNFRLLAYFWALVLSFTVFQPYSWQTAIILFLILKVYFSINGNNPGRAVILFLICGLAFMFLVLFPAIVVIAGEDFRNIYNTLKSRPFMNALTITLISSTLSTIILAAFCIPLSYALSRLEFFGKKLILSLIDIPIIIPQSAAGIMLLSIFGREQYLGGIIFGITGLRFDGTIAGIILAQVFVAMPFMIKSALSSFNSIPRGMEETARSLGASPLGAFTRVVLPLASNGITTGMILSWARAAGEFGAVLLIAESPETSPVYIYNKFLSSGLYETTPAVVTLVLFSICIFLAMQYSISLIKTRGSN